MALDKERAQSETDRYNARQGFAPGGSTSGVVATSDYVSSPACPTGHGVASVCGGDAVWDEATQSWLNGETMTPAEEVAFLAAIAKYGDLRVEDLLAKWEKYAEEWAAGRTNPRAIGQARRQAFKKVLQPYEDTIGFHYMTKGKIEFNT